MATHDAPPSFDPYYAKWDLTPDGDPITTWAGRLIPVRWQGRPAMLKVSTEPEEKAGGVLLSWWDGQGAARVFATDGEAILMERATGLRSLSDYARTGRDDEATGILCDVLATLHAPRNKPLPDLMPLEVRFRDLEPAAAAHGGLLARSLDAARRLLADQREVIPLHGDLHHDNVLDFEERGWLAIDPKRILGERAFDHAILFCDPDLTDPSRPVATLPGRFERRLEIVVERAGLDRRRLLGWIVAWTGLSAAWFLEDGEDPAIDLHIAERALAELER